MTFTVQAQPANGDDRVYQYERSMNLIFPHLKVTVLSRNQRCAFNRLWHRIAITENEYV